MRTFVKSTFGLVIAVTLLFVAIACFFVRQSRAIIVSQAEKTVRNLVSATTGKIDRMMSGVETAVSSQRWLIREKLSQPDYMYTIARELVENNDFIVGSTVAFVPDHYREKGRYFAPYVCRNADGTLKSFQLGSDSNRYHEQAWFADCVRAGRAIWSEPYFDEGGARIMMSTYSAPILDAQSNVCAVFTADLSLERLMKYVAGIRPYVNSYVIIKAGDKVLVGAEEDEAKRLGRYVGKVLNIQDRADNGWTVEIGCPLEEILREPQRIVVYTIVFSALGLWLILTVAWFYARRLQRSAALRERMAGELNTARNIQSDILPKDFPANVHATLRPAREVGGDLYDFVRRGDRLYFIIGDASGKGVPAALFSFMAGTVFRMACGMDLNPGEIVGRINAVLARNNEMCMFVTAFVGLLDLRTGCLEFGCAGHNPPVVIAPDGSADFLKVKRGPPTGAVSGTYYALQETTVAPGSKILVYTDGVTEAERGDHAQFGDRRLLEFASRCGGSSVRDTTTGLLAAVDGFVRGAEQSDDITIMTVGLPG